MTIALRATRLRTFPPDIETTLIHGIDAITADAAGALDRHHQALLYNRLDWLRLTAEHVLPDTPPTCVRAQAGDERVWLFLAAEPGRRARAFAGWYTLEVAPAFAVTSSREQSLLLLTAAARALRRDYDCVDLNPIAPTTADLVRTAFSAAGWWAVEAEVTANWVADTNGIDFDTYWRARPSRLKNTVRRKLKDGGLETHIFTRFDAAAWAEYEAVYAQSWKPEEGSPAFLRAMVRVEGEAGCLRLGLAYREGRPVAGQFWTVERGIATIHKLAYVEADKATSPGTVLSYAMFRHVLNEDRPTLIDYGNGDETYKADWMTQRRMLRRLTLFNRHSLGGVAGAARSAAATLIRRIRHD